MNLTNIAEILYKEPMYRQICRKIARSKDLADDLFQHVILNVLEDGSHRAIDLVEYVFLSDLSSPRL